MFRKAGWRFPLEKLNIKENEVFQVHELLFDSRFLWQGRRNYVRLDPAESPAQFFCCGGDCGPNTILIISCKQEGLKTMLTGKTDPLWYKDAIIYELHVKAFKDSNGDGTGDFRGLIEKLDYIEELGVNAIWLLPFYPSPFRDDGYDISDYRGIHPRYGSLAGFQDLYPGGTPSSNKGHHRAGHQSHIGSASLVSGGPEGKRQFSPPQILCLERYQQQVSGNKNNFHRQRTVQLGLGSGSEGLLLASIFFSSARPESQ